MYIYTDFSFCTYFSSMLQIVDKIVLDWYHLVVGNAEIFHCIAYF